MTSQQNTETRSPPWSRGILRPLLLVLLVLTVLAVGANVAWWLNRPTLEPMPAITEQMEPEVRGLIEDAMANVEKDSYSAAAWGDFGAVCYAHAFEKQSQICFRNAERLDPSDFRWPYLLAWSLNFADRDQMLAAYRRAAQRCGEKPHVQLRLAEILLERGELEEAEVQIEAVLSYSPSSSRALFDKARLLLGKGKLGEAKSLVERSVMNAEDKRAPCMRGPYTLLAQICRRTHDASGEAQSIADLKQIPYGFEFTSWEDPEVGAVLSLSQGRARRLSTAEELARKGNLAGATGILYDMAKGNDGSTAAELLAKTLNREGKSPEAEALLRKQLLGSPQDERLYFQLGTACSQQGKYPEAEAAYRRVVELKPDYSSAWHNLGLVLLIQGKTGEGHKAIAAAVRLNPSEVASRIKFAELLLAEGKREEAGEQLKAALKVEPQQPQARELLARIKVGAK